ncbi:MAG: hypothetical protein U0263_01255 [Polyangiaceae bacterium]
MLRSALTALAVLSCTATAWGEPSAAFPDVPKRAGPTPSAAISTPAIEHRVESPSVESPVVAPSAAAYSGAGFGGGPAPLTPAAPTYGYGVGAAPNPSQRDVGADPPQAGGASSTFLVVGGIAVGLPYATGLGIAASESFDNGSGWLAAPVVGPWLALSGRRDPCADSEAKQEFDQDVGKCVAEPLVRGMLVLDGVLQATGAVLLVLGGSAGSPSRAAPPPVMAAPSPVGRSGYGVAVAGSF